MDLPPGVTQRDVGQAKRRPSPFERWLEDVEDELAGARALTESELEECGAQWFEAGLPPGAAARKLIRGIV